MSAAEKDWKETALLWERRTTALRGIVDLLIEANEHGIRTTTDPLGCLARSKRIRDAFAGMMAREDLVGEVGDVEFRARIAGEYERRFETIREVFNSAMKAAGIDKTLEDVLGEAPAPPSPPAPRMPPWTEEDSAQFRDLLLGIYELTTDQNPNEILLRALAVYRSFAVHARGGGQVKFVKEGAPDRTLKVRLR